MFTARPEGVSDQGWRWWCQGRKRWKSALLLALVYDRTFISDSSCRIPRQGIFVSGINNRVASCRCRYSYASKRVTI